MPRNVTKSNKRNISLTSSTSTNSQSRKKNTINKVAIDKICNLDEYENNPENREVPSEVEVSDAPTSNEGNDVSVKFPCHTSTDVEVAINTELKVKPKKLATNPSTFIELVSKDVFVDKTLLIQEIITGSDDHILITRPRRWGKTLAMDMLKTFFQPDVDDKGAFDFEINQYRKKFERLKINNESTTIVDEETLERHQVNTVQQFQGHYPVIFITFSNVVAKNKDILRSIKTSISKAYQNHEYLLQVLYNIKNDINRNEADKVIANNSIKLFEEMYLNNGLGVSEGTLTMSIHFLSKLLHEHFHQKVYILIDEYDAPLNSALDQGQYEIVLTTLRPILQAALKTTDGYLEKSILTGVLRIAKADLFSGLNNFSEFNMLDEPFAQYFGFTEEEVNSLLEENLIKRNGKEETTELQKNQVKHWYNGYNIGGYTMYNPWSIMHYLRRRKLGPYWINTGSDTMLKTQLLRKADDPIFNRMLQELLIGKTIPVTISVIFSSEDFSSNTLKERAFWGLMLFSGYITTVISDVNESDECDDDDSYDCNVKIPNMEVRKIYANVFISWIQQALKICEVEYNKLFKDLLNGNIDEFQSELNEYLLRSTSFHQTGSRNNAEVFYNGLMQGLLLSICKTHDIESERESGDGRPNTILIPKMNSGSYHTAIIFKYKVSTSHKDLDDDDDATAGLHQIIEKHFNTHLLNKSHVKSVIKMGMSFFQKRVQIKFIKVNI